MKYLSLLAGLAAGAIVCSGCGGGPDVVPIEGVATHNGEPVSNIRIYFVPTDGRPSWAVTDSSGHFELDYDADHKGAKVGTHEVWILDESANVDPTAAMSGVPQAKRSAVNAQVASKYARGKSPLKVEVKKADRSFQLKLD